MPFRRFKRKKTYRKKARKVAIRRPMRIGIPYRQVRKLRYTSQIFVNPGGSGVSNAHIFSANGAYDPDISGVGGQPRFFDQYIGSDNASAMYNRFVVLGSKISLRAISGDTVNPQYFGVAVRDTASIQSDPTNYREAANSRYNIVSTINSGAGIKSLSLPFSAKKYFGRSSVSTERDLEGGSGANPQQQAFFHVWAGGLGADTTGIYFQVTIDYIILFRNPLVASPS